MNGAVSDGGALDYAKVVVLTGDLSSIATKDAASLKCWASVVRQSILEQRPVDLVALHVQGLQAAGHEFAERLQSEFVDNAEFVANFASSLMLVELKNTGLGSLYFARAADSCLVWNHASNSYAPVLGHKSTAMMSTDMMKSGALSQPDKSDADMASAGACGYALCRLQLHGRIDVSFVNLCLYNSDKVLRKNDAEKPKFYWRVAAGIRKQQVDEMFEELQSPAGQDDAKVFAGAWNAQLDEDTLMADFATMHGALVARRSDSAGFDYGSTTRYVATVTPHRFDLLDQHQWLYTLAGGRLVRKYDMEMGTTLAGRLAEHKSSYQPTRCYYKETQIGKVLNSALSRRRCPSWADRIAFNERFRDATHFDAFSSSGVYYQLVGQTEDMGEAKPVSLTCTLAVKKDWRQA